ncbi:MAG: TauD/TfdA family dioxygenase [Pseudomonadales bacterium]
MSERAMQTYIEYQECRYHLLWLRDNCPCSACRHPSGQRLHETWLLDPNPVPKQVTETADGLRIEWVGEEEHISEFSQAFLAQHRYDGEPREQAPAHIWGAELKDKLPTFDYARVQQDDAYRGQWLQAVVDYGVARLFNVPTVPRTILKVVEQFGFVRNTNYGDLFEVISEEKPVNLAYTPIPLSLHTDNPYRNPVPTLQLLHCLVKADIGGVTALTDGFKAAQLLRERDPQAFELLSKQAVTFRFASEDAHLTHCGPMIQLDCHGEIEAVRINNRSLAPLKLPFEIMDAYYGAYQALMAIVQGDDCKVTLTLEQGELIIFDNQRVMHGREVQAIGPRHLQGCYADRDGLRSTAYILGQGKA